MKELSVAEKEFCRLLALGKSKTEAYVESGLLSKGAKRAYACASARRAMERPEIRAYIEEVEAELSSAGEEAMEKIKSKVASSQWDVLEFYAREGRNPDNSMRDRLHCADSYARCKGLFVNRVETTGDFVIDVVIDDGEGASAGKG